LKYKYDDRENKLRNEYESKCNKYQGIINEIKSQYASKLTEMQKSLKEINCNDFELETLKLKHKEEIEILNNKYSKEIEDIVIDQNKK
jgi:DNA repair ATPase RecN